MAGNSDQLEKMRHSCEHVLTQAMYRLFPGIKMAMGPPIENGFYFDFDPGKLKIPESAFSKIEKEMVGIIKQDLPIKRQAISVKKARELFKGNEYKQEWLDEIEKKGQKVSLYWTGEPGAKDSFVDLCAGPHVTSTGKIGPFKLLSIAGAYWHGDEKNKMLTRIYGTCFPTQKELDEFLKQQEEAKKRDHRKLNQVLKLYLLSDDLGTGLATLLPNGAIIAEELENWAKQTETDWGYVRVLTPHIAKKEFFEATGHVPHYLEGMYPPMKMEEKGEKEKGEYYLKPMNCSFHHLVFKSEPRSYRDLPLRIAEYGTVYRYERSGELHGLMRVRGPIHQNDAHIFCTEDQAGEEFQKVMELHQYYYNTLGLSKKDYFLSFATRDEKNKDKFMGDDKMWKKAQEITLKYIKKTKLPYELEEGGAAFYGPKIDFNIRTVTGKVFSASTNQLDFFIPQAMGLKYTDKDGQEKTPVTIHRAPLGAHVRFIAFLTEHFAGAFPVWLSPVQVVIIPVTDKHAAYGQKIATELMKTGVRAELNDRSETVSAKIRDAETQKIPYMLIVGDKEVKAKKVNVRVRGEKVLGDINLKKFTDLIKADIEKKRQI
jgi:threonyl-tRNA synthetase